MLESGSQNSESKMVMLKAEQVHLLAVVAGNIKEEKLKPADALVKLAVVNFRLHEDSNSNAHEILREALKSRGFTKSKDSSGVETHTKPAANGHTISVKLHGGQAHTTLMRNGMVRGYIGSSMSVGGMHSDIEEAGETAAVEASEEGKVAS